MNWIAHLPSPRTRHVKPSLQAGLGLCIGAFVLVAAAVVEGAAGPRLVFEPEKIDFGAKPAGMMLSGTFILRNEGDEPLVVSGIESSCGCVAAQHGKRVIEPKGSTPLKFTLDTSSYNDSTIKVKTNQRGLAQVMLPIHVKVLRDVQLADKDIAFGTVPHGETRTERVMLWLRDARKPVRILSLTSTVAHVKMSHAPRVVDNRQGREISAELDTQGMPLGRFSGWVHIALDLPQQPVVKLELSGRVASGVVLSPNPLSIRVWGRALKLGVRRPVTIKSTSGRKFRIRGIKSSDPYVHAEADSHDPAARHVLAVRLARNTPQTRGTVKATVQIFTDFEQEHLVSLRVYYSVRGRRGSR